MTWSLNLQKMWSGVWKDSRNSALTREAAPRGTSSMGLPPSKARPVSRRAGCHPGRGMLVSSPLAPYWRHQPGRRVRVTGTAIDVSRGLLLSGYVRSTRLTAQIELCIPRMYSIPLNDMFKQLHHSQSNDASSAIELYPFIVPFTSGGSI